MRLVRGADGSYGYEYVADMNDINKKQADILSAQQAVMQLDKEELQNNMSDISTLITDFSSYFMKALEGDRNIDADE